MKNFYLLLLFLFCTINLYSQVNTEKVLKTIYNPSYRSSSKSAREFGLVKIDSILFYKKVTVFHITVTMIYTHGGWIETKAPGDKDAFVLIAEDKVYQLQALSGIAISPNKTQMKYGEQKSFTLTFENLPSSVKMVSLIEGTSTTTIGNPWSYWGIYLFDYPKRKKSGDFVKTKDYFNFYFKLNIKELLLTEDFWLFQGKSNMEINNNLYTKNLFPNTDTIASVLEKNNLSFYDMNGNIVDIKISNEEIMKKNFSPLIYYQGNLIFSEPIETNKREAIRVKISKKVAEKIWKEKYIPDATYYNTFYLCRLGRVIE